MPKSWRMFCRVAMLLPALQVMASDREFLRFTPEARPAWQAIDDGVMGGLSRSEARITAHGTLLFAGVVSLENNGGFASIRSLPAPLDLARARSLRLEVKGDGKRYKLNLRTSTDFDGVQYQTSFDTVAGDWSAVTLPFADFRPTFRGRPQPQAPALDPAKVVTVGLMIADRQAGPFALEVRSFRAVSD
jgi:hypothetical protein